MLVSSVCTHFNTLKKKNRKTLLKKGEFTQNDKLNLFHNVFNAICILKSFNSFISVVVCRFFELGTVPKWCVREWVEGLVEEQQY